MTQEPMAATRQRACVARRLADETRDPAAKAGLLEIATALEAEADGLQSTTGQQAGSGRRDG